ncbi:hypothetical protein HD806DRAFT_153123 [Xylariaceae sp. AK1471]|nr:hypothetical protein HD806DRAFT_153123 [Xylariaceae sp. AK1471]
MFSKLIATLVLALLPYAIAALSDSCPDNVSWTVTGLHQLDTARPNPITGGTDELRELHFTAFSTGTGATYTCDAYLTKSSFDPPSPVTQQWNSSTYACLDRKSPQDNYTLAFQFVSAWAEEKSEGHPAQMELVQEWTCGDRDFEARGTARVSLACGIPYYPYGCLPCFTHECNGTTVEVESSYVGDLVDGSARRHDVG